MLFEQNTTMHNLQGITLKLPRGIRLSVPTIALAVALSIDPLVYLAGTARQQVVLGVLRAIQYLAYAIMLVNLFSTKTYPRFLGYLAVVGVIILITLMLFPDNRPALLEVAPKMLWQTFYIMIGYHCISSNTTIKVLNFCSYIVLFYSMYSILIVRSAGILNEYITISSGFYFVSLCFLLSGKNRKLKYVLTILSILFMLAYGRRAHIVYFGITIVIIMLRNWFAQKSTQKMIGIIIMAIVVATISVLYNAIILGMADLLANWGIQSRTMNMILSGEFLNLNGRDPLYELAWNMTLNKPWTGNGIGSTMMEGYRIAWNPTNYIGCNTHNSILEVGAEFGFVGMALFILFHIKVLFDAITMPMLPNEKTVFFILFGTGVVSVLVGGSYLTAVQYALFIGYYMQLKRKQRKVAVHLEKAGRTYEHYKVGP